MKQKELIEKLEALGNLTADQKKSVTCSLIGHSNILDSFFGYVSCARCGAQLGDTLGGSYRNDKAVFLGHECDECKSNYDKLTWKDKIFAPERKEIFPSEYKEKEDETKLD
jgi:hypothetical protein